MSSIQEVRSFIFQNICEQLSPAEIRGLVFTQELPPSYLGKPATEVFMKLEMLNRYSISDLPLLSKILKQIHRKDLAKKVDEYNKKQFSKKNIPPKHADYMYMIEANLKVTQLQTGILLEQIEELKQSSIKGGCDFARVTEVIAEAVEMIEDRFQKKISFVSSLLAQRLGSNIQYRSSISVSPSTSVTSMSSSEDIQPTEDVTRLTVTLQREHEAAKMYPTKVPQSTHSLPSTELYQEPEDIYEEVLPCASPSTSPSSFSVGNCTPQNNHSRIEVGEIVTGRDSLRRAKPCPPPKKPKPKNISKVQNTVDSDYSGGSCSGGVHGDYSGGSGSTSTGDSGFVEAKRYLKTSLKKPLIPKKPAATSRYIPLDPEGRDELDYYKSRTDIIFKVLGDHTSATERVYMNIPQQKIQTHKPETHPKSTYN